MILETISPSLLSDAGPGPILIPVAGSLAAAGLFLVLAAITGGLWYARRARPAEASRWGKRAQILAGIAVLLSSIFFAFLTLFGAQQWLADGSGLAALVVFITVIVFGIRLIRRGIGSGRNDEPSKTRLPNDS